MINKDVKEILRKEFVKHNRHINIPGIYRHFKEVKDNEAMIYAVSNVSMPLKPSEMLELNSNPDVKIYMFHHTELATNTWIFRVGDRYYHPASIEPEMLVIYTGLYGVRETYVRPLPMFISKVDEGRESNQKYRLEEI